MYFWSWDNRDAGTLDFNTGMITWNEDFEGTLIRYSYLYRVWSSLYIKGNLY
jgi:hypothetical protein